MRRQGEKIVKQIWKNSGKERSKNKKRMEKRRGYAFLFEKKSHLHRKKCHRGDFIGRTKTGYVRVNAGRNPQAGYR